MIADDASGLFRNIPGKWGSYVSKDAGGHKKHRTDERIAAKADGHTPASEIARFFTMVSTSGAQPRLRSVSGVCEFNITGAGVWRIAIKDGVPTITQSATSTGPADCVITCAAEDFLRVAHREGHINVFAAVLQGLITVTGDVGFATTVLGSAILEPTGSATVELR